MSEWYIIKQCRVDLGQGYLTGGFINQQIISGPHDKEKAIKLAESMIRFNGQGFDRIYTIIEYVKQ